MAKHAMSKHGSSNPVQKGRRRQKIHDNQDNVGDPKNEPEYTNYQGEPLD
ncbi:clostri-philic family protein [Clostridium weizhouense]|uniref:Uncharacterized protein n=1 Tax=Clostridium weizhouense TaxID=2859781 RepID=A0ABS7AMZ1_9CLOT|nr:clostri-philic family protein [Clostridium weizhouense]MBW6409036.1 hypothetical protein [Clostridium weizhouense]